MTATARDPGPLFTEEPAEPPAGWPPVSVVMVVLDEERYLADAVAAALEQDYPAELEMVIALGPSRDRTDAVAADLATADPRIRLVRNESGRIPAGLNVALNAARFPVVVRVDGHSMLPPGYVRTAVALLERLGADNVGGIMAAEGVTPYEQAVARAMTTRLGVGSAAFHLGGQAGPADTVYLGVFRRDTLVRLGGYDETFDGVEDWELNYRIRQSGGLVYFAPELCVTYRPRRTPRTLAWQYFNYGRRRRRIIRRYPSSANLRYLTPPAALIAVTAGLLAAAFGRRRIGLVAPAGYLASVLAGAAVTGTSLSPDARKRLPFVYMTMHGAWAAGFLTAPRTPE